MRMKFLFAFLLSFVTFHQEGWKVCLDKKVLFSASKDDPEKNVVRISDKDLDEHKNFIVNFKETASQKGWERSIIMYDEKDNELKKQSGKKFVLTTSELKNLLEQHKTIKIYTINSPTDPKLKAQVRIRRVHLCTLVLQG